MTASSFVPSISSKYGFQIGIMDTVHGLKQTVLNEIMVVQNYHAFTLRVYLRVMSGQNQKNP